MALRTIRIFISSPGDVAEERLLARRLIGRLEAQFGGALQFEAILWERFPLVATATFQEQLLKPSDADIVVVILWSRLGTPLPSHIVRPDGSTYASGTAFEFEDAMLSFRRSGKPHILTYMKTAPLAPAGDLDSLEDAARQKRAMERFVTTWFRNEADGTLKGAFHNFAAPADFEDLLEAHLTQLAETFVPAGVSVRASAAPWRGRSPFRGLQAFEPEHAPVFFGRTAATASILAKLRAQGQAGRAFVLIVSMSGGGKSSLVRAGVLPLLLQPGIVGTATMWRHAVMKPSDGHGQLVAALDRALAQATADDGGDAQPESLGADGGAPASERIVAHVLDRLRRLAASAPPTADDAPAVCHLVLVVDQMEEAFSDEQVTIADRDAFFEAIDALARSGSVWVLATMRSDAYFRIAEVPRLVALKEGDGQFDLLPPSIREIGQIIRLPAAAAGLRFEQRPNTAEKLDDVIRDDAARNPGALPLLQFLLEELYQRRSRDDVLTFHAYEELGGVEGALVQRAETVMADVSEAARAALPTVLRELVTFGIDDESRPLRRVAPREAFASAGASELVNALLEARLLVASSGADGAAVVSLAHEALLQFWPRVKTWVDEDRELLLVHSRLEAATREWERQGRRADLLLPRGKPLAEARELVGAGIRLTPAETALLAASQRRASRFALLRNAAIGGLVLLTVAAGIAAWQARVERGRAQVQATTAQRTTNFMVSLFSNADPYQTQGDKVTVRQVLDEGIKQIDAQLDGENEVRANLLRAMGEAYSGLGLYSNARAALESSVKEASSNPTSDDFFRARVALAHNAFLDGDYEGAEKLYFAVRNEAAHLRGEVNDEVALADTGLGECYTKENKLDEAEVRLKNALAINRQLHGEQFGETARDLEALGILYFSLGRFAEAEPLLLRTVEIQRKLYGPRSGKLATAQSNLGLYYFQTGQYTRAMDEWRSALSIDEDVFGAEHAQVAALLNNLGRVELLTNHLDQAQIHMTRALEVFRRSLSDGHDDLVAPLNSIGMIELAQGNLEGARRSLDEALSIARRRNHRFLDQVLGNEADLEARLHRTTQARSLLSEARAVQEATYGDSLHGANSWRGAVLDVIESNIAVEERDDHRARDLLSAALPLLITRFGKDNLYASRAEQLYTVMRERRG
jgi:tetratricopeptide (TPR) repeat protein